MKTKLPSLTTCLILDAVGCLNYIFPPIGPVWAIISGIIFFFLFGRKFGVMGGVFSMVEEMFPGLDFIPTFTIAWLIRKYEVEKRLSTMV